MRTALSRWKKRLCTPWIRVLLYMMLLPLLPEYLALVLAILACMAAYKDARSRNSTLYVGSFFIPLAIYIGYTLIGVVYSINRGSTLAAVGMWTLAALFYIALSTVLIDRKRVYAALAYLSVGVGCNGLIAIIQYVCKATFRLNVDMQCFKWLDRILNALVGYPIFADHGNRAAASFTNPNILAESFIMFLPFMFFYLTCKTKYKHTVWSRISTVLAVFGLLFTFCRGAYLALIAMLILLFACNMRNAPLLVATTVALMMLVPNTVYARLFSVSQSGQYVSGIVNNIGDVPSGDGLDNLIINGGSEGNSVSPPKSTSERVQVWATSLDAILKRPLFGYGSGGVAIRDLLSSYGIKPPHAHNLALQLLLEGGVIGLGIWFAIAFSCVRKGYRLVTTSPHRQVGIAILVFVCSFCVISMTDYTLMTPKLVCGMTIILALIDALQRVYKQDTAKYYPFQLKQKQVL